MINAAHEILQEYRMNVVFVIYPSTGNDPNGQSYRVILHFGRKKRLWKIVSEILGISKLFG